MNSTIGSPVESSVSRGRVRRHGLMHLLMFVATFCWAANIIAIKEALRDLSPLPLVQLRVWGAALLFGILFLARPKRPMLRLTWRQWFVLVLVAISGVSLNQVLFVSGMARTSAAHTGLMVAVGPVMVLVLSCLVRLEVLSVSKFAGMLVSFCGVAVLTVGKAGQGDGGHWLGDLILLGASAVFAVYTILVKEVADQYDALTLNTLTYALGALLVIPFGPKAVFNVRWAAPHAQAWWALAYMIVFGSVVGFLIFAFALTELSAARVAAFNYIQPVIATGLAIWLLGEKLTLKVVVGGTLILLGVYLTERERGEESQAPDVGRGVT